MPHTKSQADTVTIKAAFGSDMQRDVAMRVLREFLHEWKAYTEDHHTRNEITIAYALMPGVKSDAKPSRCRLPQDPDA